ncbi:DNA 3'-5' helicase OS=Streptomyces alboniger OX=132473 GN=CP975_23600 PE=3 SV=1 [Streptomyces alboniger]
MDPSAPRRVRRRRERWESLAALVNLAQDFAAAQPGATLADFVAELDERAGAQHAPTVQGVTLASLHSAKGLEWDVVFLVGVAEGMMPITYARTDEQIEEERRLLYVGVTRARTHLYVSWSLARSPGGRPSRRPQPVPRRSAPRLGKRSRPWRDGRRSRRRRARPRGPETKRPLPGAPSAPRPAAGCAGAPSPNTGELKLLRCEECPSDMDEGLYERLREWHRKTGTAQRPARVLRLHRQDADGDRRDGPRRRGRAGADPGVGARKLNRYGADVLALCAGRDPGEVPAEGPGEGREQEADTNSSKK